MGIANDRGDQSVLDRNRERDVGLAVILDTGSDPGGIDAGNAAQGLGTGLEDEIVDRKFDALLFEPAVELAASGKQRLGVDLDFEVEMGNLRLGLQQTLRD